MESENNLAVSWPNDARSSSGHPMQKLGLVAISNQLCYIGGCETRPMDTQEKPIKRAQ